MHLWPEFSTLEYALIKITICICVTHQLVSGAMLLYCFKNSFSLSKCIARHLAKIARAKALYGDSKQAWP